jgi:hypothetical protein
VRRPLEEPRLDPAEPSLELVDGTHGRAGSVFHCHEPVERNRIELCGLGGGRGSQLRRLP